MKKVSRALTESDRGQSHKGCVGVMDVKVRISSGPEVQSHLIEEAEYMSAA